MKCEYGCNKKAEYILRNNKHCCSKHYSQCDANRLKNSNGLKKAHKRGGMKSFTEDERNKSFESHREKLKHKNPFELWGKSLRKRQVLIEQNNKCVMCGIDSWMNKPINLQLDHVDGNRFNNLRNNLRGLCPNCHSQTETFCGKNKNNGSYKVTDDDLKSALKTTDNVYKALTTVGLMPSSGNLKRIASFVSGSMF